MQQIVLQPVPAQRTQVTLSGQVCSIAIYVKNQCMLFDLAVNGVQVASAVQCKNLVSLVPTSYLGFTGMLFLFDTQGSDEPKYFGLGSRWVLLYLTSAEEIDGIAA